MRLGVVFPAEAGVVDPLFTSLAARLQERSLRLAGTVQSNPPAGDGGRCDMDVRVLGGGPLIRINQSLGKGSHGCRLDPSALERAVAEVDTRLTGRTDLVIVNKFGKHEAEGRGFRPLIAEAMGRGLPVLTAANGLNRAAFDAFSDGLAEPLEADLDALDAWVSAVVEETLAA